MRKFIYVLMITFLISGCGKPTIDTSTPEKSEASIKKVKATLPEEQHKVFEEALIVVGLSSMGDSLFEIAENADKADAEDKMKNILHGKTAQEIIEEAELITKRREEQARKRVEEEEKQQREQALLEIKELQEKIEKAEQANTALQKFNIVKSRFYKQKQRYGRDQPIIELTVQNNTGHAISRAYFEGVLATPGRSVPWLRDSFNYEISGGLEADETAEWSLAPNMFSDWGKVDMRDDMVFTVTTLRLDGADGEALFDARVDEADKARLEALTSQYGR